jgi:phage-related protein
MSVSGESQLNIGLSFDGIGQLVQVQQVLAKTGQIAKGVIESFKQYEIEFGKMAVKVAAIYNTPEKILGGAGKAVGVLHDFYAGINKDLGRIETSLGKISPKLQQLFLPLSGEIKGPIAEFTKILGNVQTVIQVAADQFTKLKKAAFDVADSFNKVRDTVPAAFQVFQDPKKLFNPEQWSTAIFPAIDAISQLRENSILFLEAVSNIPGIDKFAAKIESLVPVVGRFAKNIGTSLIENIGKFGNSLGSLASKIFPRLISSLVGVIQTVWSFTAALLANPITWIVIGVVALGAAIYLLWKNWDKVVAWFKMGFQWLKDTLFKAPNWVVGLIAVFLPFIGIPLLIIKNWGAIVNFFKNIGNFIGPIISSLWNKLVHLFTQTFNLVGSILSKILLLPVRIVVVIGVILISLLGKAFEAIGSMLGALWNKVVNIFNRVAAVVGSVISSAWGQVVSVFNSIVTTIESVLGSIFTRIAEVVGQVAGSIWNQIVNVFTSITGYIGTVIGSVFTSIMGFIGPVLSWIWDQVISVFTGIGNAIGALFSTLWNTAVNFIMGSVNFIASIISGILDFFNGIVDSVESAFNTVWSGIENAFQSIGKMFESIIPDWAKGLFDWAINPDSNSPGKNSPNPAGLDNKINTNTAGDRQAANMLNQSQNNRTSNTKNTKVDKIEINLTGGKNDQQTAKVVRNELLNIFGEQGAATIGG